MMKKSNKDHVLPRQIATSIVWAPNSSVLEGPNNLVPIINASAILNNEHQITDRYDGRKLEQLLAVQPVPSNTKSCVQLQSSQSCPTEMNHLVIAANAAGRAARGESNEISLKIQPAIAICRTFSFPIVLHALLEQAEQQCYDTIISWQYHGRAFLVHDPERFVNDVMPHFFLQTRFPSFIRQLSLYSFQRIRTKDNRDYGCYYHEMFLRGMPHLCESITRSQERNLSKKSKCDEPNFTDMPIVGLKRKTTTSSTKQTPSDSNSNPSTASTSSSSFLPLQYSDAQQLPLLSRSSDDVANDISSNTAWGSNDGHMQQTCILNFTSMPTSTHQSTAAIDTSRMVGSGILPSGQTLSLEQSRVQVDENDPSPFAIFPEKDCKNYIAAGSMHPILRPLDCTLPVSDSKQFSSQISISALADFIFQPSNGESDGISMTNVDFDISSEESLSNHSCVTEQPAMNACSGRDICFEAFQNESLFLPSFLNEQSTTADEQTNTIKAEGGAAFPPKQQKFKRPPNNSSLDPNK
jgi:hypothetical protein